MPPNLNSRIRAGSCTLAGYKQQIPNWMNQDSHLVIPLPGDRHLVAVLDGHGENGHNIAALACEVFRSHSSLFHSVSFNELPEAFRYLFALAHDAIAKSGIGDWSGSTATLCLVDGQAGCISMAHVGDSRALVATQSGGISFVTRDHVVDDEAEARINASGAGEVQTQTISGITARRVCLLGTDTPALSMSRALGDTIVSEAGLLHEPEVHGPLGPLPEGSLCIVASDGVWEKLSNDEVVGLVRLYGEDVDGAARALVHEARRRWPSEDEGDTDDITAVAVRLSRPIF